MYWKSPSAHRIDETWFLRFRGLYFIFAASHLCLVGIPSIIPSDRIPLIFSGLHYVLFPGRPDRFPLFLICGLSPQHVYIIISAFATASFATILLQEYRLHHISPLLLPREPVPKNDELGLREYVLVKDLLVSIFHFCLGCLYCWGGVILVLSWIHETELTVGDLLGIFLTPALILIAISTRMTTLSQSVRKLLLGVFFMIGLATIVGIDQAYPNPRLLAEIAKMRHGHTNHEMALRRMLIARRLEFSRSLLYCRRDHPLCKAQKAILGLKDSDEELYVNPLRDWTPLPPPKDRSHYRWWMDFVGMQLSLRAAQRIPEDNATLKPEVTLGPSFPLKDDYFIGFNRKEFLYDTSQDRITKEYVQMPQKTYEGIQRHYNTTTRTVDPSIQYPQFHETIFEDEQLLECYQPEKGWISCGATQTSPKKLEPDLFTYVDPFTGISEDPRNVPVVTIDALGIPRRFLFDCDVQFQHRGKDISISTNCLQGRGRSSETEFLQAMKTFGVPVWRFRKLGYVFAGVLRIEELELLLSLKGNEKHPSIRVK